MFTVMLRYHVPLEKIDELKADHLRHVDRQVADGVFLLGGRLVPRTGGFILADGTDRAGLERILEADPFVRSGSATYEITEFAPTKANGDLVSALGISLP
jgi:uncharacterized protein YciI